MSSLASSTSRQGFCYTGLGEEKRRVADDGDGDALQGCSAEGDSKVATTYDASGHTDEVDQSGDIDTDVDYLYDADGSVIARTTKDGSGEAKTTYYFYFGFTRSLADETTATGRTKVRYLVSSTGESLAQERYNVTGVDASTRPTRGRGPGC